MLPSVATPAALVTAVPTLLPCRLKVTVSLAKGVLPESSVAERLSVPP